MKKINHHMKTLKKIFNLQLAIVALLTGWLLFPGEGKAQKGAPCDSLHITMIESGDPSACYYDLTYHHHWYQEAGTNVVNYPHGILIEVNNPAKITNVTPQGAWFSGITSTPSPIPPSGVTLIYWTKPSSWNNIIPVNPPLTIRVYVNTNGASTINFRIADLKGDAHPNIPQNWLCEKLFSFQCPGRNYEITGSSSICAGDDVLLTLSPIPPTPPIPNGVDIVWYRYIGNPPCPTTWSPASTNWVRCQTGGKYHPTNQLFEDSCYAAKITIGCCSYLTKVFFVDVCKPLSSSCEITASPLTGPPIMYPNLTNDNRACMKWDGTLKLKSQCFTCEPTQIKWYRMFSGGWLLVPGSQDQISINTQPLSFIANPTNTNCFTLYSFKAVLSNVCDQNAEIFFNIYIDRSTIVGTVQADPLLTGTGGTVTAPVLCYDGATNLIYKPPSPFCGKIVKWQKREATNYCANPPPLMKWLFFSTFTDFPDAGSAPNFATNGLKKTTQFRIVVKNGACDSAFSPPILVTVRPKLKLTLSSNCYYICKDCPAPVLTAQLYCPAMFTNVTYEWSCNGITIATTSANQFTLNPPFDKAGVYSVIAKAPPCGTVQSNFILICDRPTVIISGPNVICLGESAILTADVSSCGSQTCTYLWRKLPTGQIVGNTPSITVQPTTTTTYSLIVICGGCCGKTVLHKVEVCP